MLSTNYSTTSGNSEYKLESLFDVANKVALVTGGGSGIGLMATQALAVNGAKVYIVGRTEEKLKQVVETYGVGIQGQIIPLRFDVSKKEDISQLLKEFSSREKGLDILVNNAGISSVSMQTEAKSAEEMAMNLFHNEKSTVEDWTSIYQTNVPQAFFMTTAFLPLLQTASENSPGWSSTVINITSISGLVKTAQHHFSYNSSKAAVIHLTRMLASEIASNGLKIRVNGIAPGVFPSEMTAGESDEDQKSHIPKEKYESKVPAQRPGKDRDMGSAVLFCVVNQYLNGQEIVVDGGYTLSAGL